MILTGIVALTALSGLGISFALLKAGVDAMWMRYPIAVIAAYGVFLLLMRAWVAFERPDICAEEGADCTVPGRLESSGSSWLDFLDGSGLDFGIDAEGCIVGIVIAAVVGIVAILVGVVASAPGLIAELYVDLVLAAMLHRRLQHAAAEHWLGTAIRKTWLSVLGILVLLAVVGWGLGTLAPGKKSIGPATRTILHRWGWDR